MIELLARAVSILGHPIVLLPVAIMVALNRGAVSGRQSITILGVVMAAMLAVGAYLVHGVRTGRLSHVDVSLREERGTFYRVAIGATAIAACILHLTGAPRSAVLAVATSSALLLIGSVLNRRIKVSLHTAFAIVAAGIVGFGSPPMFGAFAAAAAAVAWSRIALGRHTKPEVALGTVLGLVGAAALEAVRRLG